MAVPRARTYAPPAPAICSACGETTYGSNGYGGRPYCPYPAHCTPIAWWNHDPVRQARIAAERGLRRAA